MTIPLDRLGGSDRHSAYAPKRIREAGRVPTPASRSVRLDSSKGDKRSESALPASDSDDGLASEDFNLPLALLRKSSPEPRSRLRRAADLLRRPALFVPILAGVAFLFIGTPLEMWLSASKNSASEPHWPAAPTVVQKAARVRNANRVRATLLVDQPTPRPVGEAVPLGISVRDLGKGCLVVVSGFANGTTLSVGGLMADNNWWLSAADLKQAMVRPPQHFVGAMNVSVELRLADTTLQDRRTLHFKWVDAGPSVASDIVPAPAAPKPAPAPAVVASVPASAPVVAAEQPIRPAAHFLAAEEITAILKRGNDLIASGDIAAARMVLLPAAQAGNAPAAMILAGTYDPTKLQKLGVYGLSPDIALARHWYEKAKQFGSPDARRRLEMLAGRRE